MSALRFRPLAKRDLSRIVLATAERNLRAAGDLLGDLQRACQMLADHPHAGRLFGLRRKYPCPPYLIFYRPIRGGVEIIRIIDGRRDIPKALKSRR